MYCGRFAPSPTGPLHFGSLVAATASFLEARANCGEWLVRIEDVDRSRCRPHYASQILTTLEGFGFSWDGPVVYQSDRDEIYAAAIERLGDRVYACSCSRGEEHRRGCDLSKPVRSWRFSSVADEDFILRSATGGFYSYQLAVVVDDEAQGVTHVVRGADLESSTPRQAELQQALGYRALAYWHFPLALGADGAKLSKQNAAPGIELEDASRQLWRALRFLGQSPPVEVEGAALGEIWAWAIGAWRRP